VTWPAFLGFAPDGRTITTADPDSTVRTWDAADSRLLSVKVWSHSTALTLVAPDGRLVAFTEQHGTESAACVGDVATGRVVRRWSGNLCPLAFSSDGRWLATGSLREPQTPKEALLRVWDVATGTKLGQLEEGTASLRTVAFAPDGRSVFTADREPPYRPRQRDVATGRPIKEFSVQRNDPRNPGAAAVDALAVSPGGRRLALGCDGHTVRLLDVVTGQECWRSVMHGHSNCEALAFAPDGSLLATGHHNNEHDVELWDARTGQHLAPLHGHGPGCGVLGLAFSPDGRRLASASSDGTALVWDVEAVTGRRLGRPLDNARQAQLWDDLAGDAAHAAHAIDCFQIAPGPAVTFLRGKLRPIVAVPAERVAPLVAALDSPAFAVRERAARDLAALGPGAEPAVRAALAKQASAEARQRIDALLAAWDREHRRAGHALDVLEAVATPDARTLLAELAQGDPAARLTRAARASLERRR
jgi:hypothetical protein